MAIFGKKSKALEKLKSIEQNGFTPLNTFNLENQIMAKEAAIDSQVGRSIKTGNTIFQTESKNIAADTPTSYLPASGFSISNLEVGKLYEVEVRWSTGSYARAAIFYQGSNGSQIYLA